MPDGRTVARVDKLSRLVAVFDQFHKAIAQLDDPLAKQVAANWASLRDRHVTPEGIPRSALTAGMEQGLRETPMLLGSMRPEARKLAANALAAAITVHYPEFLSKDAARLEKVKARGSIRGESEYYLVRHHVDILEGHSGREEELRVLYELVDRFEARGT
jgi:hypothetical protein